MQERESLCGCRAYLHSMIADVNAASATHAAKLRASRDRAPNQR